MGEMQVKGTGAAPEDKVIFTSSRDDAFVHFPGPGEKNNNAAAGDWGSLTFELEGAYVNGYGYVGCVEPLSSIAKAHIANANYGIRIRELCAPSLDGVTFANITGNRHVMLDSTDVIVPLVFAGEEIVGAGSWSLQGGTHVVAADSVLPGKDADVGEPGKADLALYGWLAAVGAPGDSVYFRSEGQDAAGGDDWGGALLSSYVPGTVIEYASFGFASNPLFLWYPGFSTTIRNSRVHHFADAGIWIQGTTGSGAVVDGVTVERGEPLLDQLLGTVGMFLDRVDHLQLLNSTVSLSGLNNTGVGKGIHVVWGKTFCQTNPPQARSLLLQDNVVIGPGDDVVGPTGHTGIKVQEVCASANRDVDVLENSVKEWEYVAFDLNQSADLQVSCNKVVESKRSVEIYRDSQVTGGTLRFWENNWEALTSHATLFALRTNNVVPTVLGPAVTDSTGDNRLIVHQFGTKFIVETDPASLPPETVLDARENYWYRQNGPTRTLLTSGIPIRNRIVESPANSVTITAFHTTDDPHTCDLPAGATRPRAVTAELDDDDTVSTSVEVGLPRELSLGDPYPNPSRGGARLSLAVPADRTGRFELEVFDVAGRRVARWEKEFSAPGRYVVGWRGLDEGGKPLAPGMYFVRMKGPAFIETRRVTIVK